MPNRIRAFLIHLVTSALLASLAIGLVFFIWYPAPLHKAVGVTKIFLIVLGVDVVIGPLLTFVIFDLKKKSLKIDLAVIVCLQLAAFLYGMLTVAEGRPAWLVFNADRFDLVQAYQLDQRKPTDIKPEYQAPSWVGPKWVAARRPTNASERKTIMLEAITTGIDVAQHPSLYQPLSDQAEIMTQHAHSLDELSHYNSAENVAATLRHWPEADAYLPMMARVHPMTVLINRGTAKVVAIVNLNPW